MPDPVVFEGCSGWYHPGQAPLPARLGVVLCGPHGYEDLCVHRHWRDLAEALASQGIAVLRFDYPGTGDSAEDDVAPGRVVAWIAGIHHAMRALRDLAGVSDIALVGLRMGAMLATAAAASEKARALVLLAPITTGEACFRELRALAMMAVETRHRGTAAVSGAGGLEAAGFVYTPETLADLRALRLAPPGCDLATDVLVLNRQGATVDADFAGRLTASGAAVTVEGFDDYTKLLRDADFSAYPAQGFGRAVAWLSALPATPPAQPAEAISAPPVLHVPEGVETPVFFNRAPDLFGVLCVPPGAVARPALIFLNTGANRHIGTSRMTVTMARLFARLGHASLRLDVGGVGESAPVPGRTHAHPSNTASVAADVGRAMDWLEAQGFSGFILIGLCSGGKLALETALRDRRVAGQILLNLQGYWKKSDPRDQYASRRTYLRLVRNPANWKLVLRGQVDARGIAKSILARSIAAISVELRETWCAVIGRPSQRHDSIAAFRALAARQVRTQFIYVDEDPGMDELEQVFGRNGRRLAGVKLVSMAFLTEGNHVFSWDYARRKLYAAVEQALLAMVAPAVQTEPARALGIVQDDALLGTVSG